MVDKKKLEILGRTVTAVAVTGVVSSAAIASPTSVEVERVASTLNDVRTGIQESRSGISHSILESVANLFDDPIPIEQCHSNGHGNAHTNGGTQTHSNFHGNTHSNAVKPCV